MSQNDGKSFYGYIDKNLIFCGLKKIMMPSESSWNFFIKGLRLVKPSIPESFSLAADGHRKRGRFLVELPSSDIKVSFRKGSANPKDERYMLLCVVYMHIDNN